MQGGVEFPGGLVRIWHCHCCDSGLISGWGTSASHGCSQKKKRKKKKKGGGGMDGGGGGVEERQEAGRIAILLMGTTG